MTYLRKNRLNGNESDHIQPQLPHPQDINWNVRKKAPIHLNEKWLSSGKRSIESELKVYQDNLNYVTWENDQLKASSSTWCDQVIRSSIINLTETLNSHNFKSSVNKKDLAFGKKFFISKAYSPFPPEGNVEQNTKFFFHTAIDKNQSITIDLGRSYKLQFLTITNRKDACQDRARCLFYIIHGKRKFSVCDALPVVVTEEFIKPNGPDSITPLFGKRGRYLTIFSPINTALHFSSIKIFK